MRASILFLLLGLILGLAIGLLGPRWIGPYLPSSLIPRGEATEGTVVAKQRKDGELLLTVDTPEGAVLATFREKVDEIALLIEVGDTVGLGLGRYEPFAEDPPVRRVRKKKQTPPAATPEEGLPEVDAPPAQGGGPPPGATEETPAAAGDEPEELPQPPETGGDPS